MDPEKGLSREQVQRNRFFFGANVVAELRPARTAMLVLEGVRQPMMVLLLSIAVLSLVFGRLVEASVMLLVVTAYVCVEFLNKRRADPLMQLKPQPTI